MKEFHKVGNSVVQLVYKIAGKDKRDLITIALSWKKLMGSILAERAFIYKLENKTLFVNVENSVWLQELVLQKEILLQKIEHYTGIKLENILFFMKSKRKNKW